MGLLTKFVEVQEVLPNLVSNLNDSSNLPDFAAVEETHLVPLTGAALYTALVDKYEAGTLSDEEVELVFVMRRLVAAQGFLDNLAATHVFLTDVGVRVHSNEQMPKAAGWEYKELKKFLENKVYSSTEVLLLYLWRHADDLPMWKASDAYKQFEGLLIRTGTDFSDQYKLFQPMRNYYSLQTLMRDQQDAYLVSGLGQPLFDYLRKLAAPSEKEKAIIKQLKKALAYFTIKHATDHYTVRFGDSGFTIVSEFGGDREGDDSGRAGASAAGIKRLKEACDRDGKNFMSAAKKLAIALYSDGASNDFKSSFEQGPLKGALTSAPYTSGNERRKIFRF